MVALNRCVAVAQVKGPAVALELVDELGLDGYHLYHATRADLLRRLGRAAEAAAAYDAAIGLAGNEAERSFLEQRRDGLRPSAVTCNAVQRSAAPGPHPAPVRRARPHPTSTHDLARIPWWAWPHPASRMTWRAPRARAWPHPTSTHDLARAPREDLAASHLNA